MGCVCFNSFNKLKTGKLRNNQKSFKAIMKRISTLYPKLVLSHCLFKSSINMMSLCLGYWKYWVSPGSLSGSPTCYMLQASHSLTTCNINTNMRNEDKSYGLPPTTPPNLKLLEGLSAIFATRELRHCYRDVFFSCWPCAGPLPWLGVFK